MKKIFLIIIVFFCFSCVGKVSKYSSPVGIKYFSAKKTCDIMTDLQLADAMIISKNFSFSKDTLLQDSAIYDCVFYKYNCTREEYIQSLLYHTQHNIDSLNYYCEKNIENLTTEQNLLEN